MLLIIETPIVRPRPRRRKPFPVERFALKTCGAGWQKPYVLICASDFLVISVSSSLVHEASLDCRPHGLPRRRGQED